MFGGYLNRQCAQPTEILFQAFLDGNEAGAIAEAMVGTMADGLIPLRSIAPLPLRARDAKRQKRETSNGRGAMERSGISPSAIAPAIAPTSIPGPHYSVLSANVFNQDLTS